jgi:hypothetical protein
VNSRRLRTIFEGVYGGQTPLAAQRVCWITMRITDARDRSIVPQHDFIHQAHQIGVGDQGANFRFVDWHIVTLNGWRVCHSERSRGIPVRYPTIAPRDPSTPLGFAQDDRFVASIFSTLHEAA